jgi:thiol reductant ABC exporter CydD subunit
MRAAERRLVKATAGARVHLALTVAFGALGAALIVVQAAALARIIDRAFLHGAGLEDLRTPIAVLALASAGRAVLAGATEASGRIGAARTLSELRRRAVARLLLDRPGSLAGERTGELAATAVSGVDALEAWFARYLPQVALAAIVPPAIVVYLLTRDLESALILGGTIPLVPVFMILVGKGAEVASRRRFATLSALGAHFLDVVRGLPTLRAYRREAAQEETIARVGDRLRRETMATLRIAFLSALVLELLAMLGTAVAAGTIGVQLVHGSLQLEAGLAVLILAPELYAPLRQLGIQYHAGVDGVAAAERLFELAEAPVAVSRPARPVPAPSPAAAAVRLEDVTFAYPERPGDVLRGVDLELAPGTITALTGPSGAGKSTVAALVLRLADPASGRVTCDGVDLRDAAPEDWWAQIAWVPQRARVFSGTVADNIRLGAPEASDAEVRLAALDAGALAFIEELPDGLGTVVGEGGRPLSAGQAQRLAVARAFVRDAPLVVLDEPTAHLDPVTAADLAGAIRRLCAGRTALIVAHDEALAAIADRVVTVEAGRVGAVTAGVRTAVPEVPEEDAAAPPAAGPHGRAPAARGAVVPDGGRPVLAVRAEGAA